MSTRKQQEALHMALQARRVLDCWIAPDEWKESGAVIADVAKNLEGHFVRTEPFHFYRADNDKPFHDPRYETLRSLEEIAGELKTSPIDIARFMKERTERELVMNYWMAVESRGLHEYHWSE